jgi:hypothetical protein
MQNFDQRNIYIKSIIKWKKGSEDPYVYKHRWGEEKYFFYKPYNISNEIIYTNAILKKVIRDEHFKWCNVSISPKTFSNSFGQTQYYYDSKYKFEKLPLVKTEQNPWSPKDNLKHSYFIMNKIPKYVFPHDNLVISNIWIVIDNPNNFKLNDLVDNIIFESWFRYQSYSSNDIENVINTIAYIFKVDGIKYRNNKIFIPLVIPYNCFILNNIRCESMLSVMKNEENVDFEAWGNIGDVDTFPKHSHSMIKEKNYTIDCVFILYRSLYDKRKLSMTESKISLDFLRHPTYVICIMNISKEFVKSIKLIISSIQEYEFNDIEWIDNNAIIWINRHFLVVEEMDKNINFSRQCDAHLIIDNVYQKSQDIEIISINFNTIHYCDGDNSAQHTG